ncbi:hypothetical protein [Microbacterium suwonense]|uniref:PH domain-containing protein n=2 Tax=Microbacterium suwonense TaxID=683047 RepID=A0ABN6X7R1_9MICO|nr:hypothetical protein GCM10025863_20500 [Microbacterium suwonense]
MPQAGPEVDAREPRRIGPERHGSEKLRHGIRRGSELELAGYRSIWRWASRQPYVPEGASGFSYDKPVRTILIVFIGLSAVEIPVIDLLVHGIPWLRWPFIALGVWGVVTTLGILLGYLTRPHAVGPEGIRVRHGGEVDIDLPWDVVASVERRRHALTDAPQLSLTGVGDEQVLNHVIQDHSEIEIALEGPTPLRLPQGEVTVSALRISVDDPAGFMDAVRTHIP